MQKNAKWVSFLCLEWMGSRREWIGVDEGGKVGAEVEKKVVIVGVLTISRGKAVEGCRRVGLKILVMP